MNKLLSSAKAIAAVAAPVLVVLINEVSTEASAQATGLIAALAAGICTWLVPNKAPA